MQNESYNRTIEELKHLKALELKHAKVHNIYSCYGCYNRTIEELKHVNLGGGSEGHAEL